MAKQAAPACEAPAGARGVSSAPRADALETVKQAGLAGAYRVPDAALFPAAHDPTCDLTDTGIFRLVDALIEGQVERTREKSK